MAISTMYPAKAGSPKTVLANQISASATQMTVADASVLPAAPNLAVLGSDSSAEIVSYAGISGNTITGLVRGLGGTVASVWDADTIVARNITSFDHDRFKDNIETLASEKANTADLGDLAVQDTIDYSGAQITNKPTLGGIQVRPNYTISTTDLENGTSTLASGAIYFYYEVS